VRKDRRVEIGLGMASSDDVRWYISIPLAKDYDNLAYCGRQRQCAQPIEYDTQEIGSLRGKSSFVLTDVAELAGLGTHEVIAKSGVSEYPIQIAVRRDDTYVGYATELIGVPFVYVPKQTPDGHQTDLRKGADCVALVVYGRRRTDRSVRYVAPKKLHDTLDKIGDRATLATTDIREGDVLHFGFQTALIAEDREPRGKLDGNDIILHTYHGRAELRPFSELPYGKLRFDILRWGGKEEQVPKGSERSATSGREAQE